MVKRRLLVLTIGMLAVVCSVAVLASPAAAETLKYKFYSWMVKGESLPVGDVEEHRIGYSVRHNFWVFDNGEVATTVNVNTLDVIKGAGPLMQYITVTFADGSTIVMKSQGTMIGSALGNTMAAVEKKSDIIRGTGRFVGIKGEQSSKTKYLPLGSGDLGPKGYGEGILTYTLPGK